jgi:hypothetical protein
VNVFRIAKHFIWAAAATIGLISAMLLPKPASASTAHFTFELWPGGSSYLTCGWHSGPCYDDDSLVVSGTALDWGGQGGLQFYSKAGSDSSAFTVAGWGYATVPFQQACRHEVHVRVYDNLDNYRAIAYYLHTANSIADGTEFPIYSGVFTMTSTTKAIGSTADETGCGSSWTDHHVHKRWVASSKGTTQNIRPATAPT